MPEVDVYTLEAGRSILKNGKKFISINRFNDNFGDPEDYVNPCEVDMVAKLLTYWLNIHAGFKSLIVGGK